MADDYEFQSKYGFSSVIQKQQSDKQSYILQTGIDLETLGFNYNSIKVDKMLPHQCISPFFNNNSEQPDPLLKPSDILLKQNKLNIQKKQELFQAFSEETLFYIFYNVIDEPQQMLAVEQLYQKGWKYNYKNQQWFNCQMTTYNTQQCKFFNKDNWKIGQDSQIEINDNDFCNLEDFKRSIQIE